MSLAGNFGNSGLLFSLGDDTGLDMGFGLVDGEGILEKNLLNGLASSEAGISGLLLLGGGIAGEDNQFGLVLLQASNVGIKRLLGLVLATVVNGNTQTGGLLQNEAGSLQTETKERQRDETRLVSGKENTEKRLKNEVQTTQAHNKSLLQDVAVSYLDFTDGETTASTDTRVVFDSLASDDRSQQAQGTRGSLLGLLDTLGTAGNLLGRLIMPSFDVPLPILVEMDVHDLVVVLHGNL